jgi:Zn-dependent metalloprotease
MNRLRYSRGVPPSDNLMPFNVTQEEAINIAQKQVTQRHLEVEAEILFLEYIHDVPLNRYVWFVRVYLTEKSAISGTVIVVFIDLHSSEIIDVAETCWTST